MHCDDAVLQLKLCRTQGHWAARWKCNLQMRIAKCVTVEWQKMWKRSRRREEKELQYRCLSQGIWASRAHFWPNCIFNIICWQSKRAEVGSDGVLLPGLPRLPLRVMNVRLQTIIFIWIATLTVTVMRQEETGWTARLGRPNRKRERVRLRTRGILALSLTVTLAVPLPVTVTAKWKVRAYYILERTYKTFWRSVIFITAKQWISECFLTSPPKKRLPPSSVAFHILFFLAASLSSCEY